MNKHRLVIHHMRYNHLGPITKGYTGQKAKYQ